MKKYIAAGVLAAAMITVTACAGKADTAATAPATTASAASTAATTEAESTKESVTAESLTEAESSKPDGAGADMADIDEGKIDKEAAAAFAERIQEAVADMDLEALSILVSYPTYIGTKTGEGQEISTKEDFMALDKNMVFGEALVTVIANVDTANLTMVEAGVMMGEGTPNIIFNISEDGEFGITGINE